MHQSQRDRTHAYLQQEGISNALFADAVSIAWLTGYAPTILMGPHPFTGAPPLVWYAEDAWTLIVPDGNAGLADGFAGDGGSVVTFAGNPYRSPVLREAEQQRTLAEFWAGQSMPSGKLGVESSYVTAKAAGILKQRFAGAEIVGLDEKLAPLRAIKSDEELAIMQRNFDLSKVGYDAARAAIRPGMREIDVWNVVEEAIQSAAAERVVLGNDCVTGKRQGNVGGYPGDLVLEEHDSLILDISVIRAGYWSDSCCVLTAGSPSAKTRELHAISRDALAYGKSLLKPGAVAGDVDAALRAFVAKTPYGEYPHHSGHGVGAAGHEIPFIVPGSQDVLAPGMVVMLEPGVYIGGDTGVRLEDAFLITETGAVELTRHDKTLTS